MIQIGTETLSFGIKRFRGPLGTVYQCPHCEHFTKVPRGGNGSGRGYGLRVGGAAFSKMAAHIRQTHPEE